MRCVDEIRGNGVAPIPVGDARLHSQQMTAESCLPPSHNPNSCVLMRVNRNVGIDLRLSVGRVRAAAVHHPKNARGLGQSPKVFARAARVLFLSLPTNRLIVAVWGQW